MEMNNTRIVAAPTEQVWRALNDPDVLKDCVPGCESLERVTDTEWRAVVAARVGPVSARFTGKLALADLNPPTSYTLRFEGQGGPAGFVSGDAKVSLAPAETGATALTYVVNAQIGGKLAQIGSRLVDGAAAKLADDFFARFAERVAPTPAAAPGEIVRASPPAQPSRGNYARWVALAIIAAIVAWLATRGFRF